MSRFRKIAITFCISAAAVLLLACGIGNLFSVVAPQTPALDTRYRYSVKPGDTFGKIAQDYGITVEDLIALNRGNHPELARDPSLLKPGIELSVPNRSTTMATRAVQTAESIQRATILAQAATLIVSKINVARAGKGDLPLQYEARLTSIAAKRSNDMIQRSYFEHIDPANGQQPFLRYLQADGYAYQVAGENIAELKNDVGWVPGPLTVAERYSPGELAERFVTGWLGSAEHRTNIYNKSYKRTGVALSTSDDGRRVVATQVFSD